MTVTFLAALMLPITGTPVPELASFDQEVSAFMSANGIKGGAVAIARNGKLLYQRGFGYADTVARKEMPPDALFRIASISKPVTAAAVMRLVRQGKIRLDEPIYPALGYKASDVVDARILTVTVRQALQHSGGWDRAISSDPMFRHGAISRTLGVPSPVGPDDVVRYMAKQPLDFAPGSRFAYSNFGYCLLGRLIARRAGISYERFAQEDLLRRSGAKDMKIGHTRIEQRDPRETRYYSDEPAASSLWDASVKVGVPDGQFWVETMDAHGGWIASAADLVRFADAMPLLLGPDRYRETIAPPSFRRADEPVWYGLGWSVRDTGDGKVNLWHRGALEGTSTILVKLGNGLTWAALFNGLTDADIDGTLHRAANAVRRWPDKPLGQG